MNFGKIKMETTRDYFMKYLYQVDINKIELEHTDAVEMIDKFIEENKCNIIKTNQDYLNEEDSNSSDKKQCKEENKTHESKEKHISENVQKDINENIEIDKLINRDYMYKMCSLFADNSSTIDDMINRNANNWTIDRMPKVDLAILRTAICEILYLNIPNLVSINGAIELAKIY
ncbi:MAG: hypothetical protein LBR30_02790, partial [Clostridioides sp.]|nr:hypothetical protein [Clostridioides sp.]